MEIAVDVGNIVSVDADVVVVSANTSLDIEGAAGAALVAHGGEGIRGALAARAQEGGVKVGSVVYTDAGRHARIRTIAWAVIRDDLRGRADVGDELAVRLASATLWRTLAAAAAGTDTPLRVAVVPLGVVELGPETSARLVARTLAAARDLHRRLSRVTFVSVHDEHVQPLLRGVRTSFPAAWVVPSRRIARERIARAVATPSTPVEPPAAPVPPQIAAPKNLEVGSVVIDMFSGCFGRVPIGCTGSLFRVRRRDAPARFAVHLTVSGEADDVAIDGVPVGATAMLLDGDHVLTCRLRARGGWPVIDAQITGVAWHRCMDGRFSTTAPATGWRDADFDDRAWSTLAWSDDEPRGLAPDEPSLADSTIWVRLPFRTSRGRAR